MVRFVVLASILVCQLLARPRTNNRRRFGCPPAVVMARASNNAGKVELVVEVPGPVTREEMKKLS